MDFRVVLKRLGDDPKMGFRLTTDDAYHGTPRSLETIREQRTGPATSYVTVRLCETENRRQQGSYNLDKMLAAEAPRGGAGDPEDKLPIVELRPFTQKEWRPAKSVPFGGGYERTSSAISARSAPDKFDYENRGYPNPEKSVTTPRGTDCVPCPKAYTPHPGDRFSAHPRHRDSGVQAEYGAGYAPRPERERSTMGEIRSGTSMSAHYSCNKLALTEDDLQQQQRMRINGRKISHLPPKMSSMYYEPWQYYKLTKSGEIAQTSAEIINNVYLGVSGSQALLDENIYDAFDRSKTLPSIKVRRAPLRKRAPTPPSRGSSRLSQKPAYRLGVTNSLDLLSHYGKPIGVEQQLAKELRLTIEQMRKSKNNSSVIGGAFKIVPKYYDFSPTYGEKRIKSGIRHNAKKKDGTTPSLDSEDTDAGHDRKVEIDMTSKGWMSRATTYVDSGIESMNGTRSPAKNLHGTRVLSSKLQMPPGFERENIEIPSVKMYKSSSLKDLRKAESLDRLPPPVDEESWGPETGEPGKMSGIHEADREETPAETSVTGKQNTGQSEEESRGFPEGQSQTGSELSKPAALPAGQEVSIKSSSISAVGNQQGAGASMPGATDSQVTKGELSVTIPTESDTNLGGDAPDTAKTSEVASSIGHAQSVVSQELNQNKETEDDLESNAKVEDVKDDIVENK